jgi:V/A-type H+-transporting ATPase subunit I
MKKVSLVVMEKERESSLLKLRSLGLVHLEKQRVSSAKLSELLDRKVKTERALGVLQTYAADKKTKVLLKEIAREKDADASSEHKSDHKIDADAFGSPGSFVNRALEYIDKKKTLVEGLVALGRERSRMEEWGAFDPEGLSFIAEKGGINLFLYKLSHEDFRRLAGDVRYIVLGRDKKSMRLVVFDRELPGIPPFVPGEHSLKEIDAFISDADAELASIEKRLAVLSKNRSLAKEELEKTAADTEFETARAGMDILPDIPAESALTWISGFIPTEDLGVLKRCASENGWAVSASDPGLDDMIPTKLKNNRFVNLINPLTDFLEIVPGYNEPDISLWFLIFFTVFFGMIFGDAAYGVIVLTAAVIGILKTRRKGVPPILKLLLLLGSSNFIWGVLTCSWFGVDTELLPELLQKISFPLISNVTSAKSVADEGIVRQNLMIFCFSLAFLQLSIGHIIVISRAKTLKVLADIGSLGMLSGMFGVVLANIASNEYREIPFFQPCIYLLGGGFLLNFIFANYYGSIGRSVLESFKNFISMFLGIANVFGDLMSYIRLWAVGLAGAAITYTVNLLVGPLLGHFLLFVFGVMLLVFGHGLNLVLNTLSVLVHAVRLNTLEFSSHVGLTWSGTAYRPFREKK